MTFIVFGVNPYSTLVFSQNVSIKGDEFSTLKF